LIKALQGIFLCIGNHLPAWKILSSVKGKEVFFPSADHKQTFHHLNKKASELYAGEGLLPSVPPLILGPC
jgi:YHS domain-containing protein